MYRRIRELREDHDLTQVYLANLLNVNQRTYSRYETGEHEISLDSLTKIADFYNRPPRKLKSRFKINNTANQI